MERRDVDIQRRDVDFKHSLECRDVGSKRRDVGKLTLWNVAKLPRTSQRCPVLRPHSSHFCSYPTLVCLNPNLPAHPATPTLAGVPYHISRRPMFCLLTPSLTSPSPSHTLSPPSLLAISTLHLGVLALV